MNNNWSLDTILRKSIIILINIISEHTSEPATFSTSVDYLVVLRRLFMLLGVAPSITLDNSLTEFDISGLENLIKYNRSHIPLLYSL